MDKVILEMKNISKYFPGVKALDDVSFRVKEGEIHALVGENGAGKSTLMKILNGNYIEDSGKINFDGEEVEITSPKIASELGISIIFQELNLVKSLSVAENIFMGRLAKNKYGLIDWDRAHGETNEILKRIGYHMDPKTSVSELSVAQMQMVEIAKALSYPNTKLIIMDEPTTTLTPGECETLFSVMRELKAQNISVIYISHKLEEVFELCDWITVLRDGKMIESKKSFTRQEIIMNMIGRDVDDEFPQRNASIKDEYVLRVSNLTGGKIKDVSFNLKQGEVLGFAGLVGAGRTEIVRAVCGMDYIESGEIYVRGKMVRIRNPKDALKNGIAYLSEDRRYEGLVLASTVKWNASMSNMRKILSYGVINKNKEIETVNSLVKALNVKTPSIDQYVANLSGGNQQKVVIAKWLNTNAEILIFDEPTKGIDVGAKYEIYQLINQLVERGKSVILISSEMPEIVGLCDRVLVIKDGKISATLTADEINAENIMENAVS